MSSGSVGYLGPYRLLNVVNTGQTSRMWQAYDDSARSFVAIKTLLNSFKKDREQVSLLKWEFNVAQDLKHEQIIDLREYDSHRGVPYVVMEWFSAPNLKQRINAGLDSFAHLVPDILPQAAEAVDVLGKHGWVHRDIKPDNFLVSDDGKLKLIDFALARRPAGTLAKMMKRKAKVIQGTASYMSPEQILGQPLDPRADVYSLACTFFEILSGKPPFTGENVPDLLQKHLRASPPSVTARNRNVTPEMGALLNQAMAKKRTDRPATAEDFLAAIRVTRPYRSMPDRPS